MSDHHVHESGAHLVGSVPLNDAASVFRTVSAELGACLRRIPDGETGERTRWIYFQRSMLEAHPAMELDTVTPPFALYQWDGTLIRELPWIRFRDGVDLSTVTFETGYAEAALSSYAVFEALKREGTIPSTIRFQVSLPTPMASAYMYVSPSSRASYLTIYETALRRALQDILAGIPAAELAIQWDVCQEVLIYEDYFDDRPADYREQIANQLVRLGSAIPETVEMGYHLCYGSPADEHLVMPADMEILVEIANSVSQAIQRRIDYWHMPVPKDRTDVAYFQPLASLIRSDETDLYLGLIHHDDPEGDQARIRTAQSIVPVFGVAAECGWGRTDPQRIPGLLTSHRNAVELLRET